VENQLFPSLIGISPLITIHYKSLLRLRIRSSSFLSKTFNLIIISSRRFRVYKNLFFAPRKFRGSIWIVEPRSIATSPWFLPFLFAFRLINFYNSLTHYAKGTSFSSDCFFHIISSSFHSIFYGSFHHSLTVLLYYQSLIYIFSLWVVPHNFQFFSLLSFYITLYIYGILPFFFYFRSTYRAGNSWCYFS